MATLAVQRDRAAAGEELVRVDVLGAACSVGIPTVDVVIPVYNEEAVLEHSVRRLDDFLEHEFPVTARITIIDNASTDRTLDVARRLSAELHRVEALHIDEKGRGRALRAAWSTSDAPILAYMDVDLSTDLRALLPLVAPLVSGHSSVAIGSRLHPGSRVKRGLRRDVISRSYNRILRTVLRTRFRDAQCGFKALSGEAAARLLPRVEDNEWFFDTELLVLAERLGFGIHEVPVDWVDDPDSRIDIIATAIADLRGIARLRLHSRPRLRTRRGWWTRHEAVVGRLWCFAFVGAVSTLAYALLYAALRSHLTPVSSNALALLITAVANTELNRRLTFGIRRRAGRARDHAGGLLAFGLALGITTLALGTLARVAPRAGRWIELTVIIAANVVATLIRFVVLSRVVTRRQLIQR